MAYVSSNRTASTSVGPRLAEMFKQASEAFHRVAALSPHAQRVAGPVVREMDDLGLNRSMLRQAAFEAVYGKMD
jgi:hypothetical protein